MQIACICNISATALQGTIVHTQYETRNHIPEWAIRNAKIQYSKYTTQDAHSDIRHYKALIFKDIIR